MVRSWQEELLPACISLLESNNLTPRMFTVVTHAEEFMQKAIEDRRRPKGLVICTPRAASPPSSSGAVAPSGPDILAPSLGATDTENAPLHNPNSYAASQTFAKELLTAGSNGVIYRSVRRRCGQCVACFRPALVSAVRPDAHFEYRWEGTQTSVIRRL